MTLIKTKYIELIVSRVYLNRVIRDVIYYMLLYINIIHLIYLYLNVLKLHSQIN
jgi:hypothetical protein